MAAKIRRIGITLLIALAIAAVPAAFLDYFLPHHEVLRIVGTQVKHVGNPGTGGRDVYYINAEQIETRRPRVFHNEDTGWGFPWYLKFNSSDTQAVAQSIAGDQGTAAVTYYGWRIQIFSMYPNVLKIKRAEPGTVIIPWFNIAFFTVVIGGSLWLALWIRGFRNKRRLAREGARSTQPE